MSIKGIINNIKSTYVDIIGWAGTILIIFAYFLLSLSYLDSNSFLYQFINLIGSLFIIYMSLKKKVYQTVFLNIIWFFISIVAIIRIIF